jgi:hypothetical protein
VSARVSVVAEVRRDGVQLWLWAGTEGPFMVMKAPLGGCRRHYGADNSHGHCMEYWTELSAEAIGSVLYRVVFLLRSRYLACAERTERCLYPAISREVCGGLLRWKYVAGAQCACKPVADMRLCPYCEEVRERAGEAGSLWRGSGNRAGQTELVAEVVRSRVAQGPHFMRIIEGESRRGVNVP